MEHNFASAGSEKEPLFDLLHPSSPPRMKMDVLPSYDFQPLHPSTCAKVHISSEHSEPAKGRQEQDRQSYNTATVEEVERTMKKYCDNLLHGLERMSGRLTQLESTSQHLESSLLELKMSVRNNHGVTDEKLRLLENLLTEEGHPEAFQGKKINKEEHRCACDKKKLTLMLALTNWR